MFWILALLSMICVITSLLALVPLPYGIFRAFDFPRLQIATISAIGLAAAVVLLPIDAPTWWVIAGFTAALAIQLSHIIRFSPFWFRRSAAFDGDVDRASTVKVLISNVKQGNRNYQPIIDIVKEQQPDIAVFMETDQAWVDALGAVTGEYAHVRAQPQDNSYGLLVACRLGLTNDRIRFLLNEEVPSFDAVVHPANGGSFRFIVIHPEPPLPNDDTIGRDAEIAMVAKLVRGDDEPVIVTGDLNDVAWSRTTRRFLRISGLLDPREGRGLFNSFDARYFFMRWPLDHIFHSRHFEIVSMARMGFIGSDHFPMVFQLALTGSASSCGKPDEADNEDLSEADDLIESEKQRDRRPTGVDWEKD